MRRFRCNGSLSGTPLIFRKGLGLESKTCCSLFILDPRITSRVRLTYLSAYLCSPIAVALDKTDRLPSHLSQPVARCHQQHALRRARRRSGRRERPARSQERPRQGRRRMQCQSLTMRSIQSLWLPMVRPPPQPPPNRLQRRRPRAPRHRLRSRPRRPPLRLPRLRPRLRQRR